MPTVFQKRIDIRVMLECRESLFPKIHQNAKTGVHGAPGQARSLHFYT